jgi:hypothetical protein
MRTSRLRGSAQTLALGLALAAACDGRLLTIPIERDADVVIEQGTLIEELVTDFGFAEFVTMDVTSFQEIENQGVAPGDITSVLLTNFELEATGPPGADLSFIESMALYVESPGLPRVRVAHAESFPMGEALVAFALDGEDLTDYVVSTSVSLVTEATGHRPDADTTVTARFALEIGVTAQGACAAAQP